MRRLYEGHDSCLFQHRENSGEGQHRSRRRQPTSSGKTCCSHTAPTQGSWGGWAQPQGGETGPQSRPESTFTGECQWSFQSMQLRQRSRTQTDTSENKGPGSAVLNALVSGFQLMGKGFHEHRAQAPAGS